MVAELILALQAWVTRRVDVFDPVVLSVTTLYAGEIVNVIPEDAGFAATLRTLSETSIAQAQAELPPLIERIAAAHGCTADVEAIIGYPVTVNAAAETAAAAAVLRSEFGADRVEEITAPGWHRRTSPSCFARCRERSCSCARPRRTWTPTTSR